jgi:hypothetical protein
MSDPQGVAEAYVAVWNETDPSRRRERLAAGWAPGARYEDPVMAGAGLEAIDELIAGVHARFPDFRFALCGRADGHGPYVRFSWSLGPAGAEAPIEGSDVVELADGRLSRVIGFLDKVPAG